MSRTIVLYLAAAATPVRTHRDINVYTQSTRIHTHGPARICTSVRKDPRLHLQTVKAISEHAKPRGTNLIQLGNCERF